MAEDRLRYGSLIAALGAALLAVSVFLPWYALSFTASGIAYTQQQLDNVAAQFGNGALQSQVNNLHAGFAGLAGHQFTTLSAHQALKYINVVLLILAAIALIASLLRLAGVTELPSSGGDPLVIAGMLATVCVLFRIVDPPAPAEGLLSLSLSSGIWVALASSVAILAGGLWSGRASHPGGSGRAQADVWEGLSGWTPDAGAGEPGGAELGGAELK